VSVSALDLNEIVGGVSKLLRHVIGEHITLKTKLAEQSLGVMADAGMLEQVLLNMAVNARDAMPRGGTLTISTDLVDLSPTDAATHPAAKTGRHARFSVSDSGAGIPPDVLPQIFEPFFTTKESGKGTGLGLAISLGIVQQHHGWIEVKTKTGAGTTFHVYLPSHPIPAKPPAPNAAPAPNRTGPATILLTEDESAVRTVVRHVLTRRGHRVIEASSAQEALDRWVQHKDEITLLLTDIVMPGDMDGHKLAAMLQKQNPSLRVLTMSGHDPTEFDSDSSAPFTRTVLRKPFTTEELLKAIHRALHS
jgi:CheY-like chemotaxis protein